ncbi:NUDIX hydrolase [Glycomyces tarimensis]
MDETPQINRRGARGIVMDQDDHVLFVGRSAVPGRPAKWFLPGGGIDPGETPAEAVLRELYEETGLRVRAEALIGPVALQRFHTVNDHGPFTQENHLFLVRADRFEPRVSGGDAYEQDLEFRWVPVAEFLTTDGFDRIEPLLGLVKRLLSGDIPLEPVQLEPTGPARPAAAGIVARRPERP